MAEAEGSNQQAIEAYRAGIRTRATASICGYYETAIIYDRMGRADSALAYLEKALDMPAVPGRLFNESYSLAPSLKRLGELYESRGDRKKAIDYYGRFVALWKDADPALQPAVKDVRGRLARLAQEPGT